MSKSKKKTSQNQYNSPQWDKRRLEIFTRDEWKCTKCGRDDKTLHLHHKYYDRSKKMWDYPDKAFATLCGECHRTEHKHIKICSAHLIQALQTHGFMSSDFLNLENCIDGRNPLLKDSKRGEDVKHAIIFLLSSILWKTDTEIMKYISEVETQNTRS